MTENIDQDAASEPQAAPQTTGEDDATDQASEPQEAAERPENANREAAKYRRQLRDAEAERDRLAETVTRYQRAEAEQYAEAAGMVRGADLFDLGADLASMLAEDGTVDAEKVAATAAALLADRPHWRRPPTDFDLGPRSRPPAPGPSWGDVLRRA